MDDLISRQSAIDAMGVEPLAFSEYENGLHDKWEDDVEALMKLPSAQLEQRWIPCSKKFPEPNRSVLVQLSDDFIDRIQIMELNISKCEGDFFWFWKTQEMGIDFDTEDVVAWMPLPEPYKENKQ